jgi:hypothetical protein
MEGWKRGDAGAGGKDPNPEEEAMRTALSMIAGAVILIGCRTAVPATTMETEGGANDCLDAGYVRYSYGAGSAIPDARLAGITFGPLQVAGDGHPLEGVILQVNIVHPCPVDVQLWLAYDSDNNGAENARAPLELHRARTDRCAGRDPFACPCRFDGTYYFRDDQGRLCIDGPSLSLFDGLPRGGRFYLGVADTLPDDIGAIRGWAVYVKRAESVAREMAVGGPVGVGLGLEAGSGPLW